MSDNKYYSGY